MTNAYDCNKCGLHMTYAQRKTILVDVESDTSEMVHDIHVCPSCRGSVVDFINEPATTQKRNRFGRFAK